MKSYAATALIAASPGTVWAILTDAPSYSRWDSGVERVEGRIARGEKIRVFSKISPGRAFPVTVTRLIPEHTMVWSGGMPLGLFRSVWTFTLSPHRTDAISFTMREEYTGVLLSLIWRSMPDLGPSFAQFAAGLKREAERAR
jgi:hypothetical protein